MRHPATGRRAGAALGLPITERSRAKYSGSGAYLVVTTVAPLVRALQPPSGWPPPRSGLPLAELAAPGWAPASRSAGPWAGKPSAIPAMPQMGTSGGAFSRSGRTGGTSGRSYAAQCSRGTAACGPRVAGGVADLGITGLVLQESPVLIGDHGAFGDPRGDRQGGNADAGTVEGAAEPADGSGRIRRGRGRRNVVVGVAMLVEDQPGNA
jgi:hypothetical protein